eukprot:3123979-Amphidinium_carterae.1
MQHCRSTCHVDHHHHHHHRQHHPMIHWTILWHNAQKCKTLKFKVKKLHIFTGNTPFNVETELARAHHAGTAGGEVHHHELAKVVLAGGPGPQSTEDTV